MSTFCASRRFRRAVKQEFFFQADLLLISSSEPYGVCFIETMELDGETNLKNRSAMPCTQVMGDDLDGITRFDGE